MLMGDRPAAIGFAQPDGEPQRRVAEVVASLSADFTRFGRPARLRP
jgi:hypothetical protein